MSTTYTWNIHQIFCYPTFENQSDVVFQVSWSYKGRDENDIVSSRGGITSINYVSSNSFTPYYELTPSQVIGWVKETLTQDQISQMENEISGDINWQISQQNNNTPISKPLPWPLNN